MTNFYHRLPRSLTVKLFFPVLLFICLAFVTAWSILRSQSQLAFQQQIHKQIQNAYKSVSLVMAGNNSVDNLQWALQQLSSEHVITRLVVFDSHTNYIVADSKLTPTSGTVTRQLAPKESCDLYLVALRAYGSVFARVCGSLNC